MKPKLLIITGPTATGKTDLSVRLAKAIDGEIIGCDSMQVYRGMDIGTGKATLAERGGVPHYLIDVVSPCEDFTVGDYKQLAEQCIAEITARGKTPILVGGTGLYISAILSDMNFGQASKNEELRRNLMREAEEKGADEMYKRLQAVDPTSADAIHPNDVKRVVRAMEIYLTTGIPKSRAAIKSEEIAYDYKLYVLQYADRNALYARIDKRVEHMFANGLVEEVRRLYPYRMCNAMQAIGYKEVVAYLDGLCSSEEAKACVQRNSRRYAKRQTTYWNGAKFEKTFLDPRTIDEENLFHSIKVFLKSR